MVLSVFVRKLPNVGIGAERIFGEQAHEYETFIGIRNIELAETAAFEKPVCRIDE